MNNETSAPRIAAIVAAAGLSRRMGTPKQLLPWGESTVIATVVDNLTTAGAAPVICVVGHRRDEVREALCKTLAQVVDNLYYLTGEMLSSYRAGIQVLDEGPRSSEVSISGTLIALADQPHIPAATIRSVVVQARTTPDALVIPSFNGRRGHPFYLPARLWSALLALSGDETLRHLVNRHGNEIVYVNVDSDSILRDMDTPAEYDAVRRAHSEPAL